MKRCKKLLAWAGLLAIMLALALSLSPMTTAHAAARHSSATGDTLTLSLTNGPTFTYDGGAANKVYPGFQVNLVLAAPSSSPLSQVTIQLDNGQYFTGDLSGPAAD